jgi:hypothetical protein
MTDAKTAGHIRVLEGALKGMGRRPTPLTAELSHRSQWEAEWKINDTATVLELLDAGDVNSPLRRVLARHIREWDYSEPGEWASGPTTPERRTEIYERLQSDDTFRHWCDDHIPIYEAAEPLVVVAADHVDWYHPDVAGSERFYWDRYADFLERVNGWAQESIIDLDQSTTAVVERLANPLSGESRQTRGLVVGYVQSGKTANFTGVVAKAADAGYRLFIVLAGTLDILRNQTQRRLDKELVGRELLEHEYEDDDAWPEGFLSHGTRPSYLGAFDIERLTRRFAEYQELHAGIAALRFHKVDPSKPLYSLDNLRGEPARLLVVKKNRAILERVGRDLERVGELLPLAEIPVLIIDDESDQASLNTRKPTALQARRRTAVNSAILNLLKVLPRAQYVGYTATPFANVFVDPDDVDDLFPSDYMIPLPRPSEYMGVGDFHDLEGQPDGYASNERALVRNVRGTDAAIANLPAAIDSFVLSGAIKLWRAARTDGLRFQHHTMLVHVSQRRDAQRSMAQRIGELWDSAGYEASGGIERLHKLWQTDYLPVMQARAGVSMVPSAFDNLLPHIGRALSLIDEGDKRVLIVNSDNKSDDPDFDRERVWKILVGGAKLSRGYTIEGLTVSYYRRRAEATDTLMQMGRWFGFRRGYRDLVRLFIGREEPLPQGQGTIDLYLAFEGACRDELDFRRELQKYALPKYGGEGLRPSQLPPLVSSHVLRPTASNKMYNAEIRFQNLSTDYTERTLAPADHVRMEANQQTTRELLTVANPSVHRVEYAVGGVREAFDAVIGSVDHTAGLRFLRDYRWSDDLPVLQRVIGFLSERTPAQTRVKRWVVVAPQYVTDLQPWIAGAMRLSVLRRARAQTGGRYKVYSTPRDVALAKALVHLRDDVTLAGPVTALSDADQAVLLLYPVRDTKGGESAEFTTIGFAIQFPRNDIQLPIQFGVRDPSRPDAIVVDEP